MKYASPCLTLLLLLTPLGCGSNAQSNTKLPIRVTHQGQPVPDIEVRLHPDPQKPPVLQGLTGANGEARWLSGDPDELAPSTTVVVALESRSDGGWILDGKFADPRTTPIQLEWNTDTGTHVELPDDALRPL